MKRLSRFLLTLLIAIAAPAAALAQTVEPVRSGDRTVGAADAPVTLTVYLSTTCSHCADWHTDDFPAFKARFVDTGKVRVAFRDLPTPPQEIAIAGAVIARCAPVAEYETVLGALFRGQGHLRAQPGPPSRDVVLGWLLTGAGASSLTRDQLDACFSKTSFAEVEARGQQAIADGVNTTPSFFINGERVPDEAIANSRGVAAFEPLIQPLIDGW